MSILDDVRRKYQPDASIQTGNHGADKTDKRASVGFVSKWIEHFDFHADDITPEERPVVMAMVEITRMRLLGEVPSHYTSTTTCRRCGEVPIFDGCPDSVEGCPWCWNRVQGLPMPGGVA